MTAPASHPLADLFPLIEGAEFEEFCAALKRDGRLHDKIVLLDGKILDGRNRQRACDATGVVAHYRTFDPGVEGDPLKFVIAKNLHRRHLNESQRAMVAAHLATMRQGERTDLEPSANLPKVDQITAAKQLNISERSLRLAKKVQESGSPELVKAVEQGALPVSVAEKAVALPPETQREIVDRAVAGDVSGAKGAIKKAARETREAELGQRQAALPAKKYGVILADPEWRFEPWSRATGMDRAADNHYPTSVTEVIAARPVETIAADDCALFLWATAPMLPQALAVMAAWGFDYKTHLVWFKVRPGRSRGTGYWFTGEHELLLVGTRGHVIAPAPGTQFPSVFDAPVGEHSEKPVEAHEIVEKYFPTLPKIELNARRARPGWDAWGLEAPGSDAVAEPAAMTAGSPVASPRPTAPEIDLEIPACLRRSPAA